MAIAPLKFKRLVSDVESNDYFYSELMMLLLYMDANTFHLPLLSDEKFLKILKFLRHFYRAMHFSAKRGIAIACRLSVRPSVRPSVCDVGEL